MFLRTTVQLAGLQRVIATEQGQQHVVNSAPPPRTASRPPHYLVVQARLGGLPDHSGAPSPPFPCAPTTPAPFHHHHHRRRHVPPPHHPTTTF